MTEQQTRVLCASRARPEYDQVSQLVPWCRQWKKVYRCWYGMLSETDPEVRRRGNTLPNYAIAYLQLRRGCPG